MPDIYKNTKKAKYDTGKTNVTDVGTGLYGAHYPNLPKLDPPSVTYGSQYPTVSEFEKSSPVVKPSEGARYGDKYNVTDAGTGSAMTYEEYINKKNGTQPGGNSAPTSAEDIRNRAYEMSKESKDAAYRSAELQREDAYRKAQEEKQRAVVDARTAYEQNKAVYGTSAEKLASMGLTGSGYGEYINSKAQANERLQTQRAKADATSAMTYADYIEQQTKLAADEADRKARFEADTNYYNDVAYNKLSSGESEQTEAERQSNIAKAYDSIAYGDSVEKAVKDAGLNDEDAAEVKKSYEREVTYTAEQYVSSGDAASATTLLDSEYKKQNISTESYNKAYHDIAVMSVGTVETVDDFENAEADLLNMKNSGKISEDSYNSILKYMYQCAGNVLSPESYSLTDSLVYKDYFKIDGKEYGVRMKRRIDSGKELEILNCLIGDGARKTSLVEFNGKIYVYRNKYQTGGWWEVDKSNKQEKNFYSAYEKLYARQQDIAAPSFTIKTPMQKVQDYVNSHNMLEADRSRWKQDAKFRELWNKLTDEERSQIKGK